MPKSSLSVSLKGADDIFSTEESRQEQQREQVQQIPIGELFPFKDHPFKVLDDESMQRTVESVEQYGVLSPLIARPRPEGGYEIISGHRRKHAAELANLDTVPDSNPHGFPNDFESFASAIPPHRLIFNFGTLVPVSEDWRDVQEGCKKSCFNKLSKFNEYSWISCTDTKNHEGDFESPSSAIPTHRRILLYG